MSTESFPCPKCENAMFPGARFCMRCGTRLETSEAEARLHTPPPPAAPAPTRSVSGPPAPDPWASMPEDRGLEALELSLPDFSEPRTVAIPPPRPPAAPASDKALAPAAAPVVVVTPAKPGPVASPAAPPARLVPEPRNEMSRRHDAMADLSRDEVLRRVRAKQSLKRAGLAGVDLSGANLEGVDFSRADFEGAILDDAKLAGALLTNASLRNASLKGANLEGANLSRADLDGATLSDARLSRANLERASARGAKLDRAILVEADLTGIDLSDSSLSAVDLTRADARQAEFANAVMNGVRFDGAKLHAATFEGARVSTPILEWIDVSPDGNGGQRLDPERAFAFLGGRRESITPKMRYFGKGDVLRDATLEFGEGSVIHIDSRFENCLINLGNDAELTIGQTGVLKSCEIVGGGRITVHGRFFERSSPGIAGARSVTVSGSGSVVGGLEQAQETTLFAFEPGCRLRVKILKPRPPMAAE